MHVAIPSLLGNGSVKALLLHEHTSKNRRIAGRVGLCIPLLLPDNISVKLFPLQRRIVGGVVFYAVSVVSKEIRRLVPPRNTYQNTISNTTEILKIYICTILCSDCRRGLD
jgi:hypothetical protein